MKWIKLATIIDFMLLYYVHNNEMPMPKYHSTLIMITYSIRKQIEIFIIIIFLLDANDKAMFFTVKESFQKHFLPVQK